MAEVCECQDSFEVPGFVRSLVFLRLPPSNFCLFRRSAQGTPEFDGKVVNESLFLLSGKKDRVVLYHCREADIDLTEAEKLDAACKVRAWLSLIHI